MSGHEPGRSDRDGEPVRIRLLDPDEWRVARDTRLAALDDAPGTLLARHPPESSWTEEQWRRSWRSGSWAVAEAGGSTVGLARLSRVGTDAYVESVWTDPRYRNRGVASGLVGHLLQVARPAGAREIFVWVIRPNPPAFRLYKSLGFESTGVSQVLEGTERVEVRLRLGEPDGGASWV
jgi:ribosomal protein S18 acetylase RimI-like enzyme